MYRRLIALISIVFVLGLANRAVAAKFIWTNEDAADSNWCTADNWDQGDDPGISDIAHVNEVSPDRGPIIGIGCNVNVAGIVGPEPNLGRTQVMDINTDGTVVIGEDGWMWRMEGKSMGTGIININGSPWITIGGNWRGTDNGISIINIDDDPCIIVDGYIRGGDENGQFYVNMTGGYLEIQDEFLIGADNGSGEINMSGGTIHIVEDKLDIGGLRSVGPLTINMTGGLIVVDEDFLLPGSVNAAGNVWLNLYGGVIYCDQFVHGGSAEDEEDKTYTDDWRVDIEEGELRINGNVKNDIDANVAAGQITAYNGDGIVVVERVGANTVVTALPPDPNMARNGYPRRGSVNVELDVVLHWTPGDNAISYNVYLGTSFDDVNQATYTSHPSVDLNTVDVNYFDPCGPNDVEYTTTYYWRVDANNSGEIWKGNIWWFTTISPIDDPNLRVWYKFDEASGFDAHDSSGRVYDGALDGPTNLWDPNTGRWDGCRIFDDDGEELTVISVPKAVLTELAGGVTISVWLRDADRDDDNWVCGVAAAGPDTPEQILIGVPTDEGDMMWRAGSDSCDVLRWNFDGLDAGDIEGWHHWAFVKDEQANTMAIYFDGEEVASRTETLDTLVNVQNQTFRIGAAAWSQNYDFVGAMDDFRVYDHPLTLKQIQSLFRGGDLGLAWKPRPYNAEKDVAYDVVCSWNAGDYAISHDVFFGTNWDDINDVNSSNYASYPSVEYSHQDACSYDPCGLLDLDQIYYWRVDEVNSPNTWRGNIWRFTTANFITIDDFDDDTAQDPPTYDWYKIASAGITLRSTPPVIGKHSMRYAYDNWWDDGPGYYSEIESISLEPNDWTIFDQKLKLLSLWFYGKSGNAATITEQMYVYLKDNDGNDFQVKYGDADWEDMTDVQIEDWQEWLIPLSRFSTNDVNLANLDNLCIGFGIRGWGASAGYGVVYFDNIRLYPGRCIPSLRTPPAADLNNDCEVDYEDVKIMADTWLQIDVNLGAVEVPDPCVLHYKFEETSSTVTDYSGQGHHGTAKLEDGSVTDAFWEPNGVYGRCIRFEHREKRYIVAVPNDVFNSHITNNQITITVWVNWPDAETMPDETNQLFNVHGGPGTDYNSVIGIETDWHENKVRFWDTNGIEDDDLGITYAVNEPDWCYGWNHYAFVKDASINPGKLRIYHNGVEVNECDSNTPIRLPADNVWIGMATDEPNDGHKQPSEWHDEYTGLLDDFRIYNVALSEAKIKYIATDSTGIFTVRSVANLYNGEGLGKEAVNLRDFAELAKGWLEKRFWPE